MMPNKVYVTTFYSRNYGSALQAYALQQVLKALGCKPCILRQVNHDDQKGKIYLTIRAIKRFIWRFIPEKHYSFSKKIKMFRDRKAFEGRYKKIDDFCQQNIDFLDIDIKDYVPDMAPDSYYIAGSDQVWNTLDHPIGPLYLFEFPNGIPHNLYSYAASIGLEKITDEQIRYYINNLDRFQIVSLREKSTVNILSQTKLATKIRNDIDPTLLLDSDFWRNVATKYVLEDKYVFIYMLRPNEELFDMAREIARKYGLKVLYAGLMNYKYDDILAVQDAGVDQFLSYIRDAEYVVTNSFHGTCFSVQFQKKFVSVQIASTGTRASDFLSAVGLQSHLINGISELEIIDEKIQYDIVNKKLDNLRKESINYLKSIFCHE